MATSSITKNFIISGQEQVEMFVDALEASANDKTPRVHVRFRELTDENEILARLEQRKRNKANGTK